MLLHFIRSSNENQSFSRKHQEDVYLKSMPSTNDLEAHVAESCKMVSTSYALFKSKAAEQVSGINLSCYSNRIMIVLQSLALSCLCTFEVIGFPLLTLRRKNCSHQTCFSIHSLQFKVDSHVQCVYQLSLPLIEVSYYKLLIPSLKN